MCGLILVDVTKLISSQPSHRLLNSTNTSFCLSKVPSSFQSQAVHLHKIVFFLLWLGSCPTTLQISAYTSLPQSLSFNPILSCAAFTSLWHTSEGICLMSLEDRDHIYLLSVIVATEFSVRHRVGTKYSLDLQNLLVFQKSKYNIVCHLLQTSKIIIMRLSNFPQSLNYKTT